MGIFDDLIGDRTTAPEAAPSAAPTAPPAGPGMFNDLASAPTAAPSDPNAVDWSKMGQPHGELKAADPSWSQWAKWKMLDALTGAGMPTPHAQHFSEGLVNVANLVPPVGAALSGADLTYDLSRGNLGHAAMDAVGVVPGLQAARRLSGGMPVMKMAETPTTAELKAISKGNYGAVENSPVDFTPQFLDDLVSNARVGLSKRGLNPVNAPSIFNTLEQAGAAKPAGAIVTPSDLDTLRQQLRTGVPGTRDSVAGAMVEQALDAQMANPASGHVMRGTAQELGALRENLADARGNYRPYKISDLIEGKVDTAAIKAAIANSGKNLDNTTRQYLGGLLTTKAGQRAMRGASDEERQLVRDVAEGDWKTNALRSWGNRLGGGGGWGQTFVGSMGAGIGGGLSHMMGLDPMTSSAVAAISGGGVPVAGGAMRGMANARTTRAAENAAELVRQNSPEYARRAAASPPITDPYAMRRDAITYALMPQIKRGGTDAWDQLRAPFETQEQP